jgi:hypothetical protein
MRLVPEKVKSLSSEEVLISNKKLRQAFVFFTMGLEGKTWK